MAGWLGLYVDVPDIELLREHLNADPEIAFILPEGPRQWRAAWQLDDAHGKTMVWHVPGGPLPLLAHGGEEDTVIADPFAGWQERRQGLYPHLPYFGPGWPSTLLMELVAPGWRALPGNWMPLSGFSWYGRMMDQSPPPTRRWWNRLCAWIRRRSVRVTREGPLYAAHADVWAMPSGLRAIEAGAERAYGPSSF